MSIDMPRELLAPRRPEAVTEHVTIRSLPRSAPRRGRVEELLTVAVSSQALWLVPILVLQTVVMLHNYTGGHGLQRPAHTMLTLFTTTFVYAASRRLFGQGAALVASVTLAMNLDTLVNAQQRSQSAIYAMLAAGAVWALTSWLAQDAADAGVTASSWVRDAFCGVAAFVAVGGALTLCWTHAMNSLRGDFHRPALDAAATTTMHHQLIVDIGPLLIVGAVAVGVARLRRRAAATVLFGGLALTISTAALIPGSDLPGGFGAVVVLAAPLVGVVAISLVRRGPLLAVRAVVAICGMAVLLGAGTTGAGHQLRIDRHAAASSSGPVSSRQGSAAASFAVRIGG